MSKPEVVGQSIPALAPAEQLKLFAELYRPAVKRAALARVKQRARERGLSFAAEELLIIAALDTPEKVQDFLNTQLYYNNDHASAELDETALPPRRVLQTGMAHCFEGAMFAYAVNYLHDHDPRLVLLEASQDSDHNLVLVQAARSALFACNAHSRFPNLDGRRAHYLTLRALAESYVPYYYSDRTMDPNDLTLVGYSEPLDLVARFGVKWIGSEEMLWDIYYTYIDDTVRLHYLFDDSEAVHLYPLVRAVHEHWIRVDARGKPYVSMNELPITAQRLWSEFWQVFEPRTARPRGEARALEKRFFECTGTTPIDLQDNAEELGYFLERGYRVEQLLTGAKWDPANRSG